MEAVAVWIDSRKIRVAIAMMMPAVRTRMIPVTSSSFRRRLRVRMSE